MRRPPASRPDLPYTPASVEAVREALRVVLADDGRVFRLPAGVGEDEFLAAADRHRVVVFLSMHLDRLDLPTAVTEELRSRGRRGRLPCLLMAHDLHRALEVLATAGVRALTVKGVALAAQAYGDYTARGSGDLDLLVPPDQVEAAHGALRSAGWLPAGAYPAPGPAWAWRFTVRNYCELPLSGQGVSVDLHWHLATAHDAFPGFDELWDRRVLVDVGGRDVATLGIRDALEHSASHAAKDDWAWLRSVLDVHLLTGATDGSALLATSARRRTAAAAAWLLASEPVGRPPGLGLVLSRQAADAEVSVGRFPGHRTLVGLRRSSRDVRSAADTRRVLAVTVFHPSELGGIEAPDAFRGVAAAVAVRTRAFRDRARQWRRPGTRPSSGRRRAGTEDGPAATPRARPRC
ncbi:nucleotidyltransferase family protein [Nocardioides sp. CPCC 205120]|uniref:nucleotidyltransferase family protein n=1 Tax=Nocardioides sp. CPCC 205120 TaxID=3406462 RepID=UPI003B502141